MKPILGLCILFGYFILLFVVAKLTSRNSSDEDFYIAGRKSPWYIVAYGMIGASLSGVTFISIPGVVGAGGTNMEFAYMQMVLGYLVGYLIIATVLMPIYYKLKVISIYEYLDSRFGSVSYKTGASFFILSRVIGASFRLYLVALVIHSFILGPLGLPFVATILLTLAFIYFYTFEGGLKTIIWTDTLQTTFMLLAVICTVLFIANALEIPFSSIPSSIQEKGLGQLFFFENGWSDPNNFYKQFLSGALIALVMTGLDQDMMQKNLSCRNLKEAQWNIGLFSVILIVVNVLFLALGAMLYMYAAQYSIAIPDKTDQLFGLLAFDHFPIAITVLFLLGLTAAAYSSADSALTSLTTSFSIDILGRKQADEKGTSSMSRTQIHLMFSCILAFVIFYFYTFLDASAINALFKAAGYTYGPLLGLYSFGILTNRNIKDKSVWIICILAPVLAFILDYYSADWFNGLSFGFLILLVNGFLTFLGLLMISTSKTVNS